MNTVPCIEYRRRPSTLAFMARAAYPAVLRKRGRFPALSARWRGHRIEPRHLAAFERLTGWAERDALPLLYPQVLGFPLQLVILTHPALPLPIWGALQVRAHLVQHRPLPRGTVMDLACRAAGDRFLEKGAELDVHSTAHVSGELYWESLSTFYYRGRFGAVETASTLAAAPQVPGAEVARWRAPEGGGFTFGRLSGDYNPIHLADGYARRLGFQEAFLHPPVMLGQAAARLAGCPGAGTGRLDAWFKGPIHYGSDVTMHVADTGGALEFALRSGTESRPALLGRWSRQPGGPLAGVPPAPQ